MTHMRRNWGGREPTMLLPTVATRLEVNLSLTETVTAAKHSGALPMIGSRIKPMNSFEIGLRLANPSIEWTSPSAVMPTRAATTTRRPMVIGRDSSGTSSSSSPLSDSVVPRRPVSSVVKDPEDFCDQSFAPGPMRGVYSIVSGL